jgi:hypothetical protein
MVNARMWAVLASCCAAALAGCGESADAPRPTATAAQGQAVAPSAAGGAHAVALANSVCRAVLAGGAARLPAHPTAAGLTSYVNQAAPPAERAAVSLQRLARSYRIAGLDRVVDGFAQLQTVYRAAGAAGQRPAAAARAIAVRESAVTAAAQSAKLPACAVGVR